MIQIRRSVFETNSSSTHSICITSNRKYAELNIPASLYFRCENFGWEYRKLLSAEDKAAYLYASILSLYDKENAEIAKNTIWEMLGEEKIEATFEPPDWSSYGYCMNASVDHCGQDDHAKFVECILRNKGRLLRYLFSEQSFVITGNDNGYHDIEISVDYPHEEFYKGN